MVLDYAFTQGEDTVLATMAARCPDKSPLKKLGKKTRRNAISINYQLRSQKKKKM